jgi:ribosome biogenesis GTPase A
VAEERYTERRSALLEALADLASTANDIDVSAADRARELSDKLADERFVVIIAGEFKRGKSSFVNALLGVDLLPTSVIPLTSVVTIVTAGPASAEIVYRDGATERVDPALLSRYVTERENPGNSLSVDRAIIRYPSPLLDGIALVDTPGVGSVHEHNTGSARGFLPEADAAVFVISADQPLSANERDFLREVRAEAVRTFFVLNKADHLSPSELAEADAFVKGVLEPETGGPVELFAVSSREGLEAKSSGSRERLLASGFPAFEAAFADFLSGDKGSALLESVADGAARITADASNTLLIEDAALRLSVDRLLSVAKDMEGVFAEAARARDDLRPLAVAAVGRIMATIDEDLAAFRGREMRMLRTDVEEIIAAKDDRSPRNAPPVTAALEERLRERTAAWLQEERRKVGEAFTADMGRLSGSIDAIVDRTVRLCAELLDVRLETGEPAPQLASRFRFRHGFTEVPSLLGSLLPEPGRFLRAERARRRAARALEARIPEMVEMYSGRLRAGFLEQLEEGRRLAERGFDLTLEATIAALRSGLVRAREEWERGEVGAADRSAMLRSRMDGLAEIRDRLAACVSPGGAGPDVVARAGIRAGDG